jgi:predicted RNase H-like HicB family nuclease
MTFSILIETTNDHVSASLVGVPSVHAVGATRSQAIDGLKAAIEQRIALGELVALDIESTGVSSLAGKYGDDPTLRAICDDAYRRRDADQVESTTTG